MKEARPAKLILEDGSIFSGSSFGYHKSSSGEVVFNTSMMGYPESLTDPSYRGQILALTYPLIGNYGVPSDERDSYGIKRFFESDNIHVKGLVISGYTEQYSHWNADRSLSEWLKEHKVPGICGIDTRALTKKLRERGVMLGKIVCDKEIEIDDPNRRNLVGEVSIEKPLLYKAKKQKARIIAFDCGMKNNIIRCFLKRNITVLRVPWDYDISEKLRSYDGLFISNGPGDPKMCKETIDSIRSAMKKNMPIFGICLGNQLLALAAGGDTYKLKYGHRSQNQPCIERGTKRCYITSQNHGFAVRETSLPGNWKPWFSNANDSTNEGIKHKRKPFMSVQFHPEACPGPKDTEFLFDRFIEMIR